MRLKTCAWAGAQVCQGEKLGVSKGRVRLSSEEMLWTPHHAARVGSLGQDFGSLPGSRAAAPGSTALQPGRGGRAGTTRPGRRKRLLLVSEGCQLLNQERVLTIRRRLEVDLEVRQEGKELLWHPKPVFFTTTFSPTSLTAGGGGSPGCRLVPLVSRRSRRVAGLEMCFATQGFWRPPRHQVHAEEWIEACVRGSVLPSLPAWSCCGQTRTHTHTPPKPG